MSRKIGKSVRSIIELYLKSGGRHVSPRLNGRQEPLSISMSVASMRIVCQPSHPSVTGLALAGQLETIIRLGVTNDCRLGPHQSKWLGLNT